MGEGRDNRGSIGIRAAGAGVRFLATAWTVTLLASVGAVIALQIRGDGLHSVLSASMSPAIPTGSLVVTSPGRVDVGDVVVYEQARTGRLVTHRIVKSTVEGGERLFVTKGDANATIDADPVPETDVRGRVVADVAGVGAWLDTMRGPIGLAVLLAPPGLAAVFAGADRVRRRRRSMRRTPPDPLAAMTRSDHR